jgi:hypothetical protein
LGIVGQSSLLGSQAIRHVVSDMQRQLVERLDIDCVSWLRARLWKLYDEGQFGRVRAWGGEGAVEYMKQLLEHPDE